MLELSKQKKKIIKIILLKVIFFNCVLVKIKKFFNLLGTLKTNYLFC